MESIVDEEGDLFYGAEDEVAVLEVNEQKHTVTFLVKVTLMKVISMDFK